MDQSPSASSILIGFFFLLGLCLKLPFTSPLITIFRLARWSPASSESSSFENWCLTVNRCVAPAPAKIRMVSDSAVKPWRLAPSCVHDQSVLPLLLESQTCSAPIFSAWTLSWCCIVCARRNTLLSGEEDRRSALILHWTSACRVGGHGVRRERVD